MHLVEERVSWMSGLRQLSLSLILLLCFSSRSSNADMHQALLSHRELSGRSHPLLVLLVDSLRWDFPELSANRTNSTLMGFDKLKTLGGFVDRISPVFPAECYPNVVSLLTGVYPVVHGVIFSTMYDERKGKRLQYDLTGLHGHLIFNKTVSKRVHLYHLPMCSTSNDRIKCEPYAADQMTLANLNRTLQQAVAELQNNATDIAVVYYDRLDQVGHLHGPLSDEMLLVELPKLDSIIDHLVNQLHFESSSPINMIITSDHGMTEVKGKELLDRYISRDHVLKVVNRGSTVSIWPASNASGRVHHRLSSNRNEKFVFFTNLSIPAEWHTGGEVFPPVLLVAKPGYIIESHQWPIELGHYSTPLKLRGAHGYITRDKDMHIPLFALGPEIRPGSYYRGSTEDQIDVHQFIAFLTGYPSLYNVTGASDLLQFSPPTETLVPESFRWVFRSLVSPNILLVVVCILCFLLLIAFIVLLSQFSMCAAKTDAEMEQKLLVDDISVA